MTLSPEKSEAIRFLCDTRDLAYMCGATWEDACVAGEQVFRDYEHLFPEKTIPRSALKGIFKLLDDLGLSEEQSRGIREALQDAVRPMRKGGHK